MKALAGYCLREDAIEAGRWQLYDALVRATFASLSPFDREEFEDDVIKDGTAVHAFMDLEKA